MELYKKITIVFTASFILSFITYQACYFIAEKYFFDKFFYYKNINYGYWLPNQKIGMSDFGIRSQDILNLTQPSDKILGTNTNSDNIFRIAIYGDSLVWGQGIKPEERFSVILEKKLNKIRPTKVYSFGNCGDNIFDNYQKYLIAQKKFPSINFNVFEFFINDFLFNQDDNRYNTNQDLMPKLLENTTGPVYSLDSDLQKSADSDSQNYQAFLGLIDLLPQVNTVYFDLSYHAHTPLKPQIIFNQNISTKHALLTTPNFPDIPYQVSSRDGHPSSKYNQLFANTLYYYIISQKQFSSTNN